MAIANKTKFKGKATNKTLLQEAKSDSYTRYRRRLRAFLSKKETTVTEPPTSANERIKRGYIRKTFIVKEVIDDLLITYAHKQGIFVRDILNLILEKFFREIVKDELEPLSKLDYITWTKRRKTMKEQ